MNRILSVAIAICALLLSSCAVSYAAKQTKLPAHNIDVNAVETGTFSDLKELRPGMAEKVAVIGFNVKYGEDVDGIAEYIAARSAENEALIVCMSEVDRFHTRSGDINIALELAKRLKMNYAYGVEFVDFTDKTPATQGTSGNAILTKLPISNTTSLRHTVVFDWSKPAMFSDEPRDGGRMALLADVEIAPGKNIRVVSAHLENRSSAQGRAAQMDEIIKAVENVKTPVAIAGDMNDIGGTLMFDHLAKAGFSNALEKNTENTGGCRIEKDGKLLCLIKLDWILFRGLKLTGARVDGVVDSKGKLISDHKPVWSEFSVAE